MTAAECPHVRPDRWQIVPENDEGQGLQSLPLSNVVDDDQVVRSGSLHVHEHARGSLHDVGNLTQEFGNACCAIRT